MARYRKRPVVIDAVQWTGTNRAELAEFLAGADWWRPPTPDGGVSDVFLIKTLEGVMRVSLGDWIIRGVQGEFYPCKPAIFDATHEPA